MCTVKRLFLSSSASASFNPSKDSSSATIGRQLLYNSSSPKKRSKAPSKSHPHALNFPIPHTFFYHSSDCSFSCSISLSFVFPDNNSLYFSNSHSSCFGSVTFKKTPYMICLFPTIPTSYSFNDIKISSPASFFLENSHCVSRPLSAV